MNMRTKTLLAGIFALLMAFNFTSCDDDDDNITPDEVVVKAFEAKYPGATRVEWENKQGFKVVDFILDALEMEAWFDDKGTWYLTETDLPFASLPEAIRTAHAAGKYATWRVDDVDKLERTNTATVYVVEVEQGETEYDLYYAEDGTLIKEVADNGNNNGYVPSTLPSEIKDYIDKNYAGAVIEEFELEKSGVYEIDIYHTYLHKDLYFKDKTYEWISTNWDIRESEVPPVVMAALKNTPQGSWKIDDIDYSERPDGIFYVFEMEQNNQEVYVTIKIDGTVQ